MFSQLRHAHNFQVVTKLHNFLKSNQRGEMKRTYLSRRPTVTSEGRSEDGKLTLGFLGEYAAAVMVDMLHSISLAMYEDLPDKTARVGVKIARPKPLTNRFINLRAEMPNMLFSTEDWNKQANRLDVIEEPICFNKLKHLEPKTFKAAATLREHTTVCYDKVTSGTQVYNPKVVPRGRARTLSKGN